MDNRQLSNITGYRKKTKRNPVDRLDVVINKVLEGDISVKQKKISPVIDAWEDILPPELKDHSQIQEFKGNILWVKIDNPTYLYNMQTLKKELLAELQRLCPASRIADIKFNINGSPKS